VQETYARVLSRPRLLRNDDDLGYLLRVLRNTHVSRIRHSGRRIAAVPLEEDDAPAGAQAGDLRRPEFAFEVGELFGAIAALPPDACEAIVAVDVAGLSYGEAAAALRVKEATLTSRLHRARRRVAAALSSESASRL
jgi:RNA polymerase sigma-70 factor (ECF subfamily)